MKMLGFITVLLQKLNINVINIWKYVSVEGQNIWLKLFPIHVFTKKTINVNTILEYYKKIRGNYYENQG